MANEVKIGKGNLEYVTITHPCGAEADIYLYGAHITRFIEKKGDNNLLFLSELAKFEEGGAIRGGIPLVFPQFSDMGSMTKHGFVRNNKWKLENLSPSSALFSFPSPSPSHWENVKYSLTLLVSLFEKEEEEGEEGGKRGGLRVEMKFVNEGGEGVEFGVAFHTYFSVEEVGGVWVGGLKRGGERLEYVDNADERKTKEEGEEEVRIVGEVDRIYLKTGEEAVIHNVKKEGEKWRGVVVKTKRGMEDKVVWNPGKEKCESIRDLHNDDFKKYLCVEAGQVAPKVRVEGGGEWVGEMDLFTREERGGKL